MGGGHCSISKFEPVVWQEFDQGRGRGLIAFFGFFMGYKHWSLLRETPPPWPHPTYICPWVEPHYYLTLGHLSPLDPPRRANPVCTEQVSWPWHRSSIWRTLSLTRQSCPGTGGSGRYKSPGQMDRFEDLSYCTNCMEIWNKEKNEFLVYQSL